MAEAVREAIVKTGLSVEDRVLATMPKALKYTVVQIKSIIETYKNSDISTIINNLSNIKDINEIIRYITILAHLVAYRGVKAEEVLETFSREYEELGQISAGKLRVLVEKIFNKKTDDIGNFINNIIKVLNSLEYKKGVYVWIVKQRKLEAFEEEVRRYVFRNNGGNSVDRGVKLFLRVFIDKNNIPLAYKIAYNKQEIKKYKIHGDFYTTLVTMRSGAFEDIKSPSVDRLKQRIAKTLVCASRGKRCENVRIRIRSIRGLVRSVAHISGDPVAYERGAYHIGKNYCARLKCDECPIRNVCRRYIFVDVK